MNRKVVVTGGNGFIGKHVLKNLKQKGFYAITFGRSIQDDVYFNLNNRESIKKTLMNNKPDFIIHLASPAVQELYRTQKINNNIKVNKIISAEINGAYTLFATAKKIGVRKIIYGSTAAVYGKNDINIPFTETMSPKPHLLYGAIKSAVEIIGSVIFPKLINLRFFHVFGQGDIKRRLIPSDECF